MTRATFERRLKAVEARLPGTGGGGSRLIQSGMKSLRQAVEDAQAARSAPPQTQIGHGGGMAGLRALVVEAEGAPGGEKRASGPPWLA